MRLLRALATVLFIVVFTSSGSLVGVASRLWDRSGDWVLKLARFWSHAVTRIAGIRLAVEQRAALEAGRPYVFMANHVSAADIWALFIAIPVPVRMIAKKQLGRIPLFGWAMMAGRFIFIDRQNAASARRSIEEASRRIREGEAVLLFPEGTRARDGRLGSFKKGGFHLAIDAGVPIVPVALSGTFELLPPGSLLPRAGNVRVIIGQPIATAGLTADDRNSLLERVHATIAAMLGE